MKRKILLLCAVLTALVGEIFPYGAVCLLANPEGVHYRYTYSYFDLTPFGYANFAPLLVALLTCVLLFLILLSLFTARPLHACVRFLSIGTALLSLCPLLLGVAYFTPLGALTILLLHAGRAVYRAKKERETPPET